MYKRWLDTAESTPGSPPRQPCHHPACTAAGDYRAPKSREQLNDYHWFCLDHVREYNRAWNYYAGWSEAEIEAAIRHDTVWQRPTWPLGGWGAWEQRIRASVFAHPLGGGGDEPPRTNGREAPQAQARTAEQQALAVLDLAMPASAADIKSRYIQLVKSLHPDANGGDKAAEERLKTINQAYATLKQSAPL